MTEAPPPPARALGIDIGGTSIKSAVVDVSSAELVSNRLSVPTPSPASPDAVAARLQQAVDELDWSGPIGCAFPGVVRGETMKEAYNLTPAWKGLDLRRLVDQVAEGITIVNDADAAGLAESRLGAAAGVSGTVLALTFGTGIGSALLHEGRLVPDTELGDLRGTGPGTFEEVAAARNVHDEQLDPTEWVERAQPFLENLETILSTDLIVIGGGLVSRFDDYFGLLELATPVVPARFATDAGIVGAALASIESLARRTVES
jgi:polyphosphate glucokinase